MLTHDITNNVLSVSGPRGISLMDNLSFVKSALVRPCLIPLIEISNISSLLFIWGNWIFLGFIEITAEMSSLRDSFLNEPRVFGARLCVTRECVFVYLHDSSVQNHRLVSDLLQGQQEKREQGSAGLWVLKANLRISIKVEKGKTWKVTWLVHGVPKLRTAFRKQS